MSFSGGSMFLILSSKPIIPTCLLVLVVVCNIPNPPLLKVVSFYRWCGVRFVVSIELLLRELAK